MHGSQWISIYLFKYTEMPVLFFPSLRFADISELHFQLTRNPINPQSWWWTQHRCLVHLCVCVCLCMCVNKHALSAWPLSSVPAERTRDGSFSSLTAPSVKPERADTESRRDGRRYENTLSQTVGQAQPLQGQSSRTLSTHIATGTLKALAAPSKNTRSVCFL